MRDILWAAGFVTVAAVLIGIVVRVIIVIT